MYIWRNKGRRDRRNFVLSGSNLWGAPKDSENTDLSDEALRIENETDHMSFFYNQIRPIMHSYLDTKEGLEEIGTNEFYVHFLMNLCSHYIFLNVSIRIYVLLKYVYVGLVVKEFRRLAEIEKEKELQASRQEKHKDDVPALPEAARKKKNVYEVFRRYDEDGSDSLDR